LKTQWKSYDELMKLVREKVESSDESEAILEESHERFDENKKIQYMKKIMKRTNFWKQ
jgi:hypothetical protein